MSQPEWQSVIRERLIANQRQQEPYTDIVDQCTFSLCSFLAPCMGDGEKLIYEMDSRS